MWPQTFTSRLESWNNLREHSRTLDLESSLAAVNSWWYRAPWSAYHLHWDDKEIWPDPWQLLSDNIYCDVARGLGIVYTITLLDRSDIHDAKLVLTDASHNLVLVNKRKYILNWEADSIVNTIQEFRIKKQLCLEQLQQKYN